MGSEGKRRRGPLRAGVGDGVRATGHPWPDARMAASMRPPGAGAPGFSAAHARARRRRWGGDVKTLAGRTFLHGIRRCGFPSRLARRASQGPPDQARQGTGQEARSAQSAHGRAVCAPRRPREAQGTPLGSARIPETHRQDAGHSRPGPPAMIPGRPQRGAPARACFLWLLSFHAKERCSPATAGETQPRIQSEKNTLRERGEQKEPHPALTPRHVGLKVRPTARCNAPPRSRSDRNHQASPPDRRNGVSG